MEILAISGSLRDASSNTTLLRAMGLTAPEGVAISIYDGLGALPYFNPDLEASEPPTVLDWRDRLRAANGVLISSPEYAHGVPGALKNALDWVVGSGEFVEKPVALLNAAPHATYAQASLMETLRVMTARVIIPACAAVPLAGKKLDAPGIASHPELAPLLRASLNALLLAIRESNSP